MSLIIFDGLLRGTTPGFDLSIDRSARLFENDLANSPGTPDDINRIK